MLNTHIPNFNILSYLVAVFDLNSNFSNFPIATGKNWCGGMRVFGPWHANLVNGRLSLGSIYHHCTNGVYYNEQSPVDLYKMQVIIKSANVYPSRLQNL